MTQKWNLQDIQPSKTRRTRPHPEPTEIIQRQPREVDTSLEDDTSEIVITDGNKSNRRTLIIAVAIFIVFLGGGIIASILMGGAEITVTPRSSAPNVNAIFTADATPAAGDLPFEILTLEVEGERQVQATGQENVSVQAEGTILIYNNFQSEPIRLVTNTRFESDNGLIFRVKDPAVVPGYTTNDAGERVPGVVSAEVFADQPGEEYNLKPGRFTIPGFAGEPEFDAIFAESVETFKNGFSGMRFIIDEAELKTATQALRTELRNSLLSRVESEKPAGFVVFSDAITFTYDTLPAVEYGDDLATIKEKATMRIPMFKEADFASHIAEATIPGYENAPVRIEDYSVFSFEYTNATTSATNIATLSDIPFKLVGRPLIVWTYDTDKLKADLANKNRTAIDSVLDAYPAIKAASATIRPFWKKTFPINIADIEVIEQIE